MWCNFKFILLGKPPKLTKEVHSSKNPIRKTDDTNFDGNFLELLVNVLRYPSVSNKNFLISIGLKIEGVPPPKYMLLTILLLR